MVHMLVSVIAVARQGITEPFYVAMLQRRTPKGCRESSPPVFLPGPGGNVGIWCSARADCQRASMFSLRVHPPLPCMVSAHNSK